MHDIQEICKKLRPVLGRGADALWLQYASQTDLRKRRRVEALVSLLEAKHLGNPAAPRKPALAPPEESAVRGDVALGTVTFPGRGGYSASLTRQALTQHVAIFGRSGAGKTNLGFNLIGSFSEQRIPFLIFDWKRNYRDVLARPWGEGTALYTPGRPIAPFRFNPLVPPPGVRPEAYLPRLCEVLAHSHFLGEGVMYLLQRTVDRLYQKHDLYGGNPRSYPTLHELLQELRSTRVDGRERLWMASTLRAIDSLCYGEMGRMVNHPAPLDLDRLLRTPTILELDALSHANKLLLIECLMLWIHLYRMDHAKRDTLHHIIFIEEAHHVLHRGQRDGSASGESLMEVILREIRELGESVIMLDQMPSLFSPAGFANSYTTIAFNLKSAHDVRAVADAMLMNREDAEHLGRLEVGDAIVKLQGRHTEPFLIRVPKSDVIKSRIDDTWLGRRSAKSDLSNPTTAQPPLADPSSQQVSPWTDTPPPVAPGSPEAALLLDVAKRPWATVTDRYSALGLSKGQGSRVQRSLLERGLVRTVSVATGTGKVVLLEPTDPGRATLRSLGFQTGPSPRFGSPLHSYWQHHVAEQLREAGWNVTEEWSMPDGRAVDLVAERGGDRIGVEIETGKSDVLANITKCQDAGFTATLVLFTDRAALDRWQRNASEAGVLSQSVTLALARDAQSLLTDEVIDGGTKHE